MREVGSGNGLRWTLEQKAQSPRQPLTLRTLPPALEQPQLSCLAQASGFSLHAGVAVRSAERAKLERLCRYISRPAVASARLALTAFGAIRYTLKSPYRDGTTHVVFEPLDFIARLAALVPRPCVHLTRFHGVFAPNSHLRAAITPAGRGPGRAQRTGETTSERHRAMTWMQRLKRRIRR